MTRCALKGIKLPTGVRLLKGLTFYSAIFRDYELRSWFEFRLGNGLTLDEAEEQIANAVKSMRAGKESVDGGQRKWRIEADFGRASEPN